MKWERHTPSRAPLRPAGSSDEEYPAAAGPALAAVASSWGSTPVSAPSRVAASATVRAMGPAVSWLWAMGMTPARLTRPSVGLMPTIEQQVEGDTMEPSVSVPMAAAHRLAATATPEPELDPDGVRSSA